MEYIIYVGTFLDIKEGFLKGSFKIMYCGMSDDKTFSIAPFVTKGYQGFSPNVFYSLDSKIVRILNKEFDVIEVTPDHIILAS